MAFPVQGSPARESYLGSGSLHQQNLSDRPRNSGRVSLPGAQSALAVSRPRALDAPAGQISGARSNRPELAKVLKRLDTGDVLIVTRLDRLARSTRDLLNILDDIAKSSMTSPSVAQALSRCMTPGQTRPARTAA
jgi:hypothetical protein